MCDIGCAGHNPPTAIKHFFFLSSPSCNTLETVLSNIPTREQCLSPPLRHSGHKTDLKWIKLPSWSDWSSCSDSREGRWGAFCPRRPLALPRSTSATGSPPISPPSVISPRPCCHLLQQVFYFFSNPCRHEGKMSCARVTWRNRVVMGRGGGVWKRGGWWELNNVFLLHFSRCYWPINYNVSVSAVLLPLKAVPRMHLFLLFLSAYIACFHSNDSPAPTLATSR